MLSQIPMHAQISVATLYMYLFNKHQTSNPNKQETGLQINEIIMKLDFKFTFVNVKQVICDFDKSIKFLQTTCNKLQLSSGLNHISLSFIFLKWMEIFFGGDFILKLKMHWNKKWLLEKFAR